jgi:hypothetical protein
MEVVNLETRSLFHMYPSELRNFNLLWFGRDTSDQNEQEIAIRDAGERLLLHEIYVVLKNSNKRPLSQALSDRVARQSDALRRLRIDTVLPRLADGEVARFKVGSPHTILLLDNWKFPEEDWTWTAGAFSTLLLPLAFIAATQVIVSIDVTPFAPRGIEGQRVSIRYGDRVVHNDFVSERKQITFRVSLDPACNGVLPLRIELPNARSLKSLGVDSDSTVLGLQLHAASVKRA